MKTVLIYHSDDIESVSMTEEAGRQCCYYPVAIVACSAFPHSHSQRLGIRGVLAPIDLCVTKM